MCLRRRKASCQFRFGGDYTWTARTLVTIPGNLGGRFVVLQCYVVPSWTPLLISLPILQKLEASLDFAQSHLYVGLWKTKVPVLCRSGHLEIDLWRGLTKDLANQAQDPKTVTPEFAVYLARQERHERVWSRKQSSEDTRPNGNRGEQADCDASRRSCGPEGDVEGRTSGEPGGHARCGFPVAGRETEARSNTRWRDKRTGGATAETRMRIVQEQCREGETTTKHGDPVADGMDSCSEHRTESDLQRASEPRGDCGYLGQVSWGDTSGIAPGCELLQVAARQPKEIQQRAEARSDKDSAVDRVALRDARKHVSEARGLDCKQCSHHGVDRCDERKLDHGQRSNCSVDTGGASQNIGSKSSAQDGSGDVKSIQDNAALSDTNMCMNVGHGCAIKTVPEGQRKRLAKHVNDLLSQQKQPQHGLAVLCFSDANVRSLDTCSEVQVRHAHSSSLFSTAGLVGTNVQFVVCLTGNTCKGQEMVKVLSHRCRVPWLVISLDDDGHVLQCWTLPETLVRTAQRAKEEHIFGLWHYLAQEVHVHRVIESRAKEESVQMPQCRVCCAAMEHVGHDCMVSEKNPHAVKHLCARLLECLSRHPLPKSVERSSVYRPQTGEVRGVTCGFIGSRGVHRGTNTSSFADALEIVHALARARQVNHVYTTVQFNALEALNEIQEHSDQQNAGDSWTLAFGSYTGGQLELLNHEQWCPVHSHHCWVRIPFGVRHRVTSVLTGCRYSIVLYTPKTVSNESQLSSGDRCSLRKFGFPVCLAAESSQSCIVFIGMHFQCLSLTADLCKVASHCVLSTEQLTEEEILHWFSEHVCEKLVLVSVRTQEQWAALKERVTQRCSTVRCVYVMDEWQPDMVQSQELRIPSGTHGFSQTVCVCCRPTRVSDSTTGVLVQ
eukprot:6483405-Amphidinium_carterae.2